MKRLVNIITMTLFFTILTAANVFAFSAGAETTITPEYAAELSADAAREASDRIQLYMLLGVMLCVAAILCMWNALKNGKPGYVAIVFAMLLFYLMNFTCEIRDANNGAVEKMQKYQMMTEGSDLS